jgi:hypothetical protein
VTLTSDWLGHLYDQTDTGWLTLFAVDRTTGERITKWHRIIDHDWAADEAAQLAETCCVWFGVAPRERKLPAGKRGGAGDCLTLPAMWLDIDIASTVHAADDLPPDMDAALELLADFPIPPTAVINSGHGLQAWWKLTEPIDADLQATAILADWGTTWAEIGRRRGWHVDNVFDIARVMRLPGTLNRKADPVPVSIIGADWTRTYGVDDLAGHMLEAPTPQAPDIRRDVPYIGPERPGDAYNAVTSGAAVLERAGFHFDHQDSDGSRHYRAPHRTERNDTTGATVYADGHTTLWSETFARNNNMDTRRPYDAYGLFTHIEHRGDWAAASRALRADGYGSETVDLTDDHQAKEHMPAEIDDMPHGWERVDLALVLADGYEPPVPSILQRIDGKALFYRGRMNALYGESGSGKSWVALKTAAQILADGGNVVYIDLEDHPGSVASRLMAIGVARQDLIERFAYISPDGGWNERAGEEWERFIVDNDAELVVIDSTGEAMAADGTKPNDDDEVARWFRRVPRRLARAGACVLVLDHVPKSKDTNDRFAIGSQRKLAAIDGAAYRVEVGVAPAKGIEGHINLITTKDRGGNYQHGAKVAEIDISDDGLGSTTVNVKPPGDGLPTVLMTRICQFIAENGDCSALAIEKAVNGKATGIRFALSKLIDLNYVDRTVRTGKGGGFTHSLIRMFNESDLWITPNLVPSSQPRPAGGTELSIPNLVPSSPIHYKGDEGRGWESKTDLPESTTSSDEKGRGYEPLAATGTDDFYDFEPI